MTTKNLIDGGAPLTRKQWRENANHADRTKRRLTPLIRMYLSKVQKKKEAEITELLANDLGDLDSRIDFVIDTIQGGEPKAAAGGKSAAPATAKKGATKKPVEDEDEDEDDEDEDEDEDEEEDEEEEKPSAKKAPAKKKPAEEALEDDDDDEDEDDEDEDEDEDEAPKKPAAKKAPAKKASVEDEDDEDEEDADEDGEEKPAPKRRGRPPKKAVEESEDEDEDEAEEKPAAPPLKAADAILIIHDLVKEIHAAVVGGKKGNR